MGQELDDESFQALIDIAPKMLHLKYLKLTLSNNSNPQEFRCRTTGFPRLTNLTVHTTSKRFEDIVPLLGPLKNLTIVGSHPKLVDDHLLTSMKGLYKLIKLAIILQHSEATPSPLSLVRMIDGILLNHVTLIDIDIYRGWRSHDWISQPRCQESSLLSRKFKYPLAADGSGTLDGFFLDKIDTEKSILHVHGSYCESMADQRVMDMVCRYQRLARRTLLIFRPLIP